MGKQSPTVHATFRPTNVSEVVQLSECFKGKEICVLPADDQEIKPELEKKITAGGGTLTQYWSKFLTDYFIGKMIANLFQIFQQVRHTAS